MGKKVFLVRAISSNGGEIFHLDVEHPICFSPAVILLFRNVQSIYDECEQNKNKENKNKEEEERMPCGMTRRETNGTKREKQAYYTVHSAPKKKLQKVAWQSVFHLKFHSIHVRLNSSHAHYTL